VLVIPITLRNCLHYLFLNREDWEEKWVNLALKGNFRTVRHLILDKKMIKEDELPYVLKDFTILSPIKTYSIM
jgi:hypothetical protein